MEVKNEFRVSLTLLSSDENAQWTLFSINSLLPSFCGTSLVTKNFVDYFLGQISFHINNCLSRYTTEEPFTFIYNSLRLFFLGLFIVYSSFLLGLLNRFCFLTYFLGAFPTNVVFLSMANKQLLFMEQKLSNRSCFLLFQVCYPFIVS